MMSGSYVAVRRTYEATQGKLRPEDTPAKGYLEAWFEQIEDGEVKAELLSEVVGRKEEDAVADPGRGLDLTHLGTFRMRRVEVQGRMPADIEELGTKYELMAVQWGQW